MQTRKRGKVTLARRPAGESLGSYMTIFRDVALVFGRHTSPASSVSSFSRCTWHVSEMLRRPVSRNRLPSASPLVAQSTKPPREKVGPQICAKLSDKMPKKRKESKLFYSQRLQNSLTLAVSWLVVSVWCRFSKAHKVDICIRPTLPSPFIAAIVCLSWGSDSVLP